MDELRDVSDLRPAPRTTPTAWLWVMAVVVVVATLVLVGAYPEITQTAHHRNDARCWPLCGRSEPVAPTAPLPKAAQAAGKTDAKPDIKPGAEPVARLSEAGRVPPQP
jgi:hypothetical protein